MSRLSMILAFVCAVLVVLAATAVHADWSSAIQNGADRVVEVQHTDGKWGWPIDVPPTYNNITGPIGLGLLSAYGKTADADHYNSAVAAGNSLVGLTSDWVGTYNPLFLVSLYDATGSSSYMSQAQTFFTELQAGTYTRQSVDYNTADWITQINSARSGSLINMRPWEFAPQAYAATRAGNSSQETTFSQAIEDGIETLDSNEQLDLFGLAGGVMGLGWMGSDFDPVSGSFASAGSTADLADILVSHQNANGSLNWQSGIVAPTVGDEDLQTTAYAMLALSSVNNAGQYDSPIVQARGYLLGTQLPNGGWPSYPPDGQEYAEIDGEVVWALSAAVPEPSTLVLLITAGLGALGYAWRRRRS